MRKSDLEAIVKYRISKSYETLEDIDVLITNQLWDIAVNRIYYAC